MPICECSADRIENKLKKKCAILKNRIKYIQENKNKCDAKEDVKRYRSYIESYGHIREHFQYLIKQNTDTEKWLISGASLAYSWMPRSLILHICHKDKAKCSLIKLKENQENLKTKLLNEECNHLKNIIIPLRDLINNSIRGTSKFLHFSFPDVFPIWDSRVANALDYPDTIFNAGKNNNDIRQYLAYARAVHGVCDDNDFMELPNTILMMKKMESIMQIEEVEPIRKIKQMESIMQIEEVEPIRKIKQMESIRKVEQALFLIGYKGDENEDN